MRSLVDFLMITFTFQLKWIQNFFFESKVPILQGGKTLKYKI